MKKLGAAVIVSMLGISGFVEAQNADDQPAGSSSSSAGVDSARSASPGDQSLPPIIERSSGPGSTGSSGMSGTSGTGNAAPAPGGTLGGATSGASNTEAESSPDQRAVPPETSGSSDTRGSTGMRSGTGTSGAGNPPGPSSSPGGGGSNW